MRSFRYQKAHSSAGTRYMERGFVETSKKIDTDLKIIWTVKIIVGRSNQLLVKTFCSIVHHV